MRWRNRRRSDNVEDRRSRRLPLPSGRAKSTSIWTILIAIAAMLFFDIDPRLILGISDNMTGTAAIENQEPSIPNNDELAQFTAVVLADTEDTWHEIFRHAGEKYKEPKLRLYRRAIQSACGFATAASGPFYCPADHRVYIDLNFFKEMKEKYSAGGDFAQAYVIAHEVGHHVQTLLGYSQKISELQRRSSQAKANALSVRLELQADCLAGLWAHHTEKRHQILESGDIEEAVRAAHAIGDDTLQKHHHGHIVPDSFTHGTSAQRIRWFKRGLKSGDFNACNTFEANPL